MGLFSKKSFGNNMNVVMITLDGLRYDFIDKLPILKELVSKSSYFDNVITYAPHSTGAFYAIHSGIYGKDNGVNSYFGILNFNKDKCKLLAEYFRDKGYFTLGDSMSDIILPKYGFDNYSSTKIGDDVKKKHSEMIENLSKLKKNFFVHFHVRCIHDGLIENVVRKYKFDDKEYYNQLNKNKEDYLKYLLDADNQLKGIIDQLKSKGLYENSIFVVLSDHGCSCGEKFGERYYGALCYDITLRTFVLFHNPKIFPEFNSSKLVRTVDIMPTILESVGISHDEKFMKFSGKSLFPIIKSEEKEERVAFSETAPLEGSAPHTSPKDPIIHSVKKKNWKLIYTKPTKEFELYDVEKDPKEENNLFGKGFNEENSLKEILKQYVEL